MPVFESNRKVQVFGSSLAMTLPAMFVKANEIEKGTKMRVIYDLNGVLIVSKVENSNNILNLLINIVDKLKNKVNFEEHIIV